MRQFSLFAAPSEYEGLLERLEVIAAHPCHCCGHASKQMHTIYGNPNSRQPRPPLRVVSEEDGTCTLQYCSFPDTNAALKTTSEQVITVQIEEGDVDGFLCDSGHSRVGTTEYIVSGYMVKECHLHLYKHANAVLIRLSGADEQVVLSVAALFGDVVRFEHVDNALLK